MSDSELLILETLDAGVASSNVTILPRQGPMTIQAYGTNFDATDVTVQGSIDGIAWTTLSTTLSYGATVNAVPVTTIYSQIKLVCAGDGTAGRTLVVKARIYTG